MLNNKTRPLAGVIGYFNDPHDLVKAMEKVRDAKFEHFDAFTPFPVHGLDPAQGLKRSPLPFVTMAAGLTGCILGFSLQYWTSVVDWPLNIGGKPFNSWPAFVPVMFEATVLFAGLATVGGMFILNRLPNVTRRSFDPRLTSDRFALIIEAPVRREEHREEGGAGGDGIIPNPSNGDPLKKHQGFRLFNEADAQAFLKQVGASDVKSVFSEGWF